MNKKANVINIIYMILILFLLLIVGFGIAFGSVVIDWTTDEIFPEISNLGMIGNTNLSEAADYTFTPLNNIIQSFTWLTGLLYIFAIAGCLGLAFAFRFTGNKWLMIFFIMCIFLLILAAIFISNIYEEFYRGTDEVAIRLQEQNILSFLILYSPVVICIIGFICGIIMFTGEGEELII